MTKLKSTEKSKRKVATKFKFVKDKFHNDKIQLAGWIEQPGVDVRCVEWGSYDDGTEFMNIIIEGFKP